jgi:Zn-dependent M28 family amino/carboxypeptidase
MRIKSILAAALLAGVAATTVSAAPAAKFDPARISEHVRILASDEFEGRGPDTPGEQKAIAYIAKQFEAVGLEPGGDKGTWFQDVTLLRTERSGPVTASFRSGDWNRDLKFGGEIVVGSQQPVERVTLKDAPLVFVGYGVHAPERGWDDWAGVDMRGKVAVVLVNDPDFEADLGGLFGGKAMTYYGRWTYKFEEAARQGAAGVLVVHEDRPASYTWRTVEGSWSAPQFDIVRVDPMKERAPMQGWIQRPVAVELFQRAGLDFEAMKAAAQKKGFKPVPLKASFSTDFGVKATRIVSHNVIGRLKGAKRPAETIVYGAHWDHLGRGVPDKNGDDIYNGAVDNASGTAGLIEVARAFASGKRPDRSVIFIAYTAEEKGLLGSEYYASHPIYPLEKTVGGFNMDGLPIIGRSKNIEVVGFGQSEMQDLLTPVAARQGRRVDAESTPEAGSYFRSDHFPFAKRGVPMLYAGSGEDLEKGGVAAGKAAGEDYIVKRYHQPDDEWSPDIDWSGAVQDLEMVYEIGLGLANSNRWPEWKAGSEFKVIRDKTAASRK